MSTQTARHHYRNVYKSDHLGVADLEDMIEQGIKDLVFVIKEVRQEIGKSVAGKKGDFNIAYFTDPKIKPWVLNAGNAKAVKNLYNSSKPANQHSSIVEDWKDIPIRLYIDYNIKMKGETVGGIKIDPIQPKIGTQPKPLFDESRFQAAKEANATIEGIKQRYELTPEVEQQYLTYVGTTK